MRFRHERIDSYPLCNHLGFCLTSDLTGSRRPDVVGGGGHGPFGRELITSDDSAH